MAWETWEPVRVYDGDGEWQLECSPDDACDLSDCR